MGVKILIFSFFLLFLVILFQSYEKTIYGKPKIIDGDTVHINNNKIRLHAIDAPEMKQTCTKDKIIWNCGIQSKNFLKQIIDEEKITCRTTGRDKYKRFGILLLNGFLFKVFFAAFDTPFVYMIVYYLRKKFNLKENEDLGSLS